MEERKNINKVVGILHSTDKKAYEARGESYYLAYIERGGVTIPIITSKYFASTFNGKKVECTGVICTASSEVYEICQILSYFYCVVINECPEDTRDTGYVRIEGFVKSCGTLSLHLAILLFVNSSWSVLSNWTNKLHAQLHVDVFLQWLESHLNYRKATTLRLKVICLGISVLYV